MNCQIEGYLLNSGRFFSLLCIFIFHPNLLKPFIMVSFRIIFLSLLARVPSSLIIFVHVTTKLYIPSKEKLDYAVKYSFSLGLGSQNAKENEKLY